MLDDLRELYRKILEDDPDYAFRSYAMKSGLYIRMDPKKSFEENLVGIEDNMVFYDKSIDAVSNQDLFDWFRERDYYSYYLDDGSQSALNKSIDGIMKRFHNINHMTLFAKMDTFDKNDNILVKVRDLLDRAFDNMGTQGDKLEEMYVSSVKDHIKRNGLQKLVNRDEYVKELLYRDHGDLYDYAMSEDRKELIERYRKTWIDGFDSFVDILSGLSEFNDVKNKKSIYIKVFFDDDIETYKKEYMLYTLPRIYSKNEFSRLDSNYNIIGVNSFGQTYSSNKKFLRTTQTKFNMGRRESFDDAVFTKDTFMWLNKAAKDDNIFSIGRIEDYNRIRNEQKMFVRMERSDFDVVLDFENIPVIFEEEFMVLKDYFGDRGNEKLGLDEIRDRLSYHFFDKKLSKYLYSLEIKAGGNVTNEMVTFSNLSKEAFIQYFEKGNSDSIKTIIDKMTYNIYLSKIRRSLSDNNMNGIDRDLNVRWNLLSHFNVKGKSNLGETYVGLLEWLGDSAKEREFRIDSSDKFNIVAGQLLRYLDTKSESANKTMGMLNRLSRFNNVRQVKNELIRLSSLYGHAINANDVRFKEALSSVLLYNGDSKISNVDKEFLIAGFVGKSVFYNKGGN